MKAQFFVGILCLISSTLAQNCGFYSGNGTTITTQRLNETSAGNYAFWTGLTYNVNTSASQTNYSSKFVTAEWSVNMYILRTHPNYTWLVGEEKDLSSFEHAINFVCLDSTIFPQRFHIPFQWLRDPVNRHRPYFDKRGYVKTIRLSDDSSVPISIPIMVIDEDVRQRNANVVIRSSNAGVNLLVRSLWTEIDDPPKFAYQVDFLIDSNAIDVGHHEIILTADDGLFSNSAYLDLTIIP